MIKLLKHIIDAIMSNKPNKQFGYTLVELAISTSIIAMLAIGALSIIGKKNESDSLKITHDRLEKIEMAIEGFVRENRYVPCPANPALAESSSSFGLETTYNTATDNCSNVTNGTGAVPVRTLGLPDDYAYDGWNRKFTYRSADSSGNATDFDSITFHGDLAVMDRRGIHKTNINELPPYNNGAIYVVLSHGSNGGGVAWSKNDSTAPSPATGVEMANTDHIRKAYIQAPKTETFDDIVVYGMKKNIIPPYNIVSPMLIDPLTCENAKAIVRAERADLSNFDGATAGNDAISDQIFASAEKISALCSNQPEISVIFNPNSVTGLNLWLDASDSSTLFTDQSCTISSTNGANVGCWEDQSDLGRDATNNSNRPVYTASAINGIGGVTFNKSGQTRLVVDLSFLNNSSYTIFGVQEHATNSGSYFIGNTGSGTNNALHFGWLNGTTIRLGQYSNDLDLNAANPFVARPSRSTAIMDTTSGKEIYHVESGSATVYSNSNSQTAPLVNITSTEGRIGTSMSDTNSNFLYEGDLGEILAYNEALATNDRTAIESYLADKWGVNVSTTPVVTSSASCPPGLTYYKDDDRPEGACQCPDGQVLFQELNNSSACYFQTNGAFNSCATYTDTEADYGSATPTDSGQVLWLDAADCSTITLVGTTGDRVELWEDKSPLGNNATQSTLANMPTYTLNAQNSLPAIVNSNTHFMTNSTLALGTTASIYTVAATGSGSGTKHIINNDFYFHIGVADGSGSTHLLSNYYGNGSAWGTTPTHQYGLVAENTYYIMSSMFDGTDNVTHLNGVVLDSLADTMTANTGSEGYEIGRKEGSASEYWDAGIGEILIYNTALTDTEQLALLNYLSDKWDINNDPDDIVDVSLSDGLMLWLDASDSDTVYSTSDCSTTNAQNGDPILCWQDKSGEGNNVTQNTMTNQPTYKIGMLNLNPVVDFDGDDYLRNSSFPDFTDVTIFVVGRYVTGNTSQGMLEISNGSANSGASLFYSSTNAVFRGYDGSSNDASLAATLGQYYIFTGLSDGSDNYLYHDQGEDQVFVNSISSGNLTNTLNQIDIGRTLTNYLDDNSKIAEVLVYNEGLSTADREYVELYLKSKWGL